MDDIALTGASYDGQEYKVTLRFSHIFLPGDSLETYHSIVRCVLDQMLGSMHLQRIQSSYFNKELVVDHETLGIEIWPGHQPHLSIKQDGILL